MKNRKWYEDMVRREFLLRDELDSPARCINHWSVELVLVVRGYYAKIR